MRGQVMTGNMPFNKDNRHRFMLKILNGDRPERPEHSELIGLSDSLWQIVEDCWKEDFKKRTTICDVVGHLNQITQHWVTLSPVGEMPVLENLELNDSNGSIWSFTGGKLNPPRYVRQSFSLICRSGTRECDDHQS